MPLVKAPGLNVIVRLSLPKTPVIDVLLDVLLRVAVIFVPTMLTSSLAVSTMLVFTSTFSVELGVVNKNVGASVSVTPPPPPEVVYSTSIFVTVVLLLALVNTIELCAVVYVKTFIAVVKSVEEAFGLLEKHPLAFIAAHVIETFEMAAFFPSAEAMVNVAFDFVTKPFLYSSSPLDFNVIFPSLLVMPLSGLLPVSPKVKVALSAHVADVVMAVNSNMTNLSMSHLRCEAESPVTRLANEVILLIILFVCLYYCLFFLYFDVLVSSSAYTFAYTYILCSLRYVYS